MADLLARLRDAMNAHDAHAVAALFAEDYRSVQPVHPDRAFAGRDQVLANWTSVFEGVHDFTATITASARDGDTTWSEWSWQGHYSDGSTFAMCGVMIVREQDGLVAEARLYLEPVDDDGGDIGVAVHDLYRPPA